jgi:hypothetical protein
MRNTYLWLGAILLGGVVSAAVDGDLRSEICAYRNSIRAELRQYRNAEREMTSMARAFMRARAEAQRAEVLNASRDARQAVEEQRNAVREQTRDFQRETREIERQIRQAVRR